MKIIEVITKKDARDFLQVPVRLYANNPYWIQPLNNDINLVFDKDKNKTFMRGDCCRWLLCDETGLAIGRVAAFINKKAMHHGNDQPTGGMGFFECPNDKKAAFMLFDQCKHWLIDRGVEAMDGPINFGNRDKWWGLLIDGFNKEPNYQCNYNFPYYRELFEAYGFRVYFKQFTFARKILDPLSDKLDKKANRLIQDSNYSFRHLNRSDIPHLAKYITEVYNKAWAQRAGENTLSLLQAELVVKKMKPILDTRLIYFGFYKGDPVSFFISIPEINQILKHVKGKMDWWGKGIFFLQMLLRKNRKALGILFGVVPEHQGKGLDGAMITCSKEILQKKYKRYDDYEMNWIGDFNPYMIAVIKQTGAHLSKTHYTYRKLFDENKPFKRYPIKA